MDRSYGSRPHHDDRRVGKKLLHSYAFDIRVFVHSFITRGAKIFESVVVGK